MNQMCLRDALAQPVPHYSIVIDGRITGYIEKARYGGWSKTLGNNVPRPLFIDEWKDNGDAEMTRRVYPRSQAQALVRVFRKHGMNADMVLVTE